jgi:hypothetical protein
MVKTPVVLYKILVMGIILLFIGALITPTIASDTATSTTLDNNGSLLGYVNDTSGNPIEGALIRVHFHGTYEEDYSDSTGFYHVTNIPICWCMKNATCSKEGYKTEWVLLSIVENTTHDFVLTSNHSPVPKIDCMGAFEDSNVEPGQNVSGQIKICNRGDELSLLNWEIDTIDVPTWGTWKFIPESDTNLSQGYCDICSVGVQLTSEEGDYCGIITIYNSDNLTDYCEVYVWFKPRVKATTYSLFQFLLERFPFLEVFLRAMNLLR